MSPDGAGGLVQYCHALNKLVLFAKRTQNLVLFALVGRSKGPFWSYTGSFWSYEGSFWYTFLH